MIGWPLLASMVICCVAETTLGEEEEEEEEEEKEEKEVGGVGKSYEWLEARKQCVTFPFP